MDTDMFLIMGCSICGFIARHSIGQNQVSWSKRSKGEGDEAPRFPEGEKSWSVWLVLKESTENRLLTLTGHRAPAIAHVFSLLTPADQAHDDHPSAVFVHGQMRDKGSFLELMR